MTPAFPELGVNAEGGSGSSIPSAQEQPIADPQNVNPKNEASEGEVLPNIEQRTLPRNIERDTVGPNLESGEPVSLADIRKLLGKALDIPFRWGVGRQRALGFFRPKEEVIRMKAMNDVPTIAHEVGPRLGQSQNVNYTLIKRG